MRKFTATLFFICSVLLVNAQDWFPLGNGLRSGSSRFVTALTEFNGDLIAGGVFRNTEGTDTMFRIARWDGTSWKQMGVGGGFNAQVFALIVFNGELYAGGEFVRRHNDDGTDFVGSLAKWDGTKWMPVAGLPEDSRVYAMIEHNNELILARRDFIFDPLVGVATTSELKVTTYDGTTFTDLPGIFKGPETAKTLEALCVYDNKIIATGRFDSIDNMPARLVAAYDGSAWASLDFPSEGTVEVLPGTMGIRGNGTTCAVYDNKLFVGGYFTSFNYPNAAEPTALASYDGTDWTRHQFAENDIVSLLYDLVLKNDTMFVLGAYYAISQSSGDTIFGVSIYDENETPPFRKTNFLPTISSQSQGAMVGLVYNNSLHVGGSFERAGSNEVNNITRFDPTATLIVSTENLVKNETVKVYPNPTNNILNITSTTTQFNLQLTDVAGKVVYTEAVNGNDATINVSQYSKGIYFLQVNNATTENSAVYKVVVE
jgi:hypothetical protein